jgi:hypothetical protein
MSEQLPQIHEAPPPQEINILTGGNFDRMMKIAEFFAKSDLIPTHFQGKPANVFIALEVAHRHNMSIFAVMQSLYVVHGRPGFEGKFLIALANQAGWNLQFDIQRDSAGKIIACTAVSDRGGVKTFGPKITAEMVRAEGWDRPKGSMASKWITLPELMYRYRAGAYFVNTVCPQLKMGMPTVEEIEDMTVDITPEPLTAIASPEPELDIPPAPEPPSFDDMVSAAGLNIDMVAKYIQAFAAHKKNDVENVTAEAVRNWDKFTASFKKWEKKQAPQESPQSPPAPPAEQPQTNGQANGSKIVRPITDDQIDQIELLCKEKNMPLADALISEGLPSELIELDFDSANGLIEKLAAL